MCERTYVACDCCGARAEEEVQFYTETTTREYATLDGDGDPAEWTETVPGAPTETGYYCNACEREVDLDHEHSEEDCDCRECDPNTAAQEYEDPDELVLLTRRTLELPPLFRSYAPAEVRFLFTDRALTSIPIRAERLAEIVDEARKFYCYPDLTTPVPADLLPLEVQVAKSDIDYDPEGAIA